jgi:p-aminobenzoyl-glutamate transporter AbgT
LLFLTICLIVFFLYTVLNSDDPKHVHVTEVPLGKRYGLVFPHCVYAFTSPAPLSTTLATMLAAGMSTSTTLTIARPPANCLKGPCLVLVIE